MREKMGDSVRSVLSERREASGENYVREIVVPKMRVRRRDFRKGGLFVAGVFAAVFLFVFLAGRYKLSGETEAANLDNFDPGYIISDYAMGNYTSMTEAEIQAFLSSKVSCSRGEGYYNYLTAAYPGFTWHLKDGHIVCLPEELFGSGETIGTGETAAHIIWQAAQDYRINPQVLIVLLQKEQGLITDDYPNTRQYRSAMGYGCPDTAPCAEEYYGFRNQVRKAAELFRTVLDGGWTNYPLGENYIQYNPSWDCGGSMVNIRSLATSALYRYTPYQPNAAALAAGYGTGDGCSAYGNRNFYHYFEDWFSGIVEEGKVISEIAKYVSTNAQALGERYTDELCGLKKNGCYQAFEGGYVYWTAETGVHAIENEIFERWFKKGTEWGILGYPINDKENVEKGVYRQKFENGYIYYSENTGAWDISGGILYTWNEKDSERTLLGYPTSGELTDANGNVYQTFEHGAIYWDVKTGGWLIKNFAAKRWEELGGFKSKLGMVVNDGVCGLVNGGCFQAFRTGNIYWTEKTGAWDVSGGIYQAYLENGTEWGILGYPTSGELTDANGNVYQTFEHGAIYWDVKTGASIKINE